MRVAYVCTDPGIPVWGSKGASVHVQAVLRVLVRRGAQVHLLAARTGGPAPADLASVTVHALPPVGRGPAAERERSARAGDGAVRGLLHALEPDVVWERYALWGATATAWSRRRGVPCVLEVNAPLVQEQAAHRELTDPAAAEAVAAAAISAAGAVVCVSDEVAVWARARSDRPERVHAVPNGVDTDRIMPGPPRPADRLFRVGFVGTLKPWHGTEVLVEAHARLAAADPTWRLLLVGDGPCAGALRAQAAAAGTGGLVELTGAVDPAGVCAHLHRMDAAVAPYPALDGFYFSPLKVYEYLAAGLPVVASRVGQVPAALDGGRLGDLVEPADPGALARALAALRADPARRRHLARVARDAAVRRHTWDRVVDRALGHAGVSWVGAAAEEPATAPVSVEREVA